MKEIATIQTCQMTDAFMQAASASAKAIHEGSLLEEPIEKWAQVHRSSWEPLAMINELGLITHVSQDAIEAENGDIKSHERSFVEGMMFSEAIAEEFVQKVNMFTDKIAYRMAGNLDPQSCLSTQLISPSIIVTKWPVEGRRGFWQHGMGLRLNMKARVIDNLKRQFGVPVEIPVSVVAIIDPKWGRTATSKKGLFNTVIKALTPGEYKWSTNERLDQRYQEWLAEGR